MTKKTDLPARSAFKRFVTITTRWMDNDAYRHVNNVVYYSLFDTAVNQMLLEESLLDIEHGDTIGLVVSSQCNYYAPVAFPDVVHVGVRVGKLGRTSVTYEIAIFRNDDSALSAFGNFTHVYVDRQTNRPQPLKPELKEFLSSLE
ncbi:thioesterase family protein [Parasphingorhabdus sp. JC815]|uniref:acyl-CoA thioesterase n=1 Tax=Parasphingorhabdus sp. JC815 TaxID=3232140 RepID=UPI003458F425